MQICICSVDCWSCPSNVQGQKRAAFDSVYSWQLYSAALLGEQAACPMIQFHSQLYYCYTELTATLSYGNIVKCQAR